MGALHDRLRMSLRSMYGHEDRDFSNVLSDLIDATPADIGNTYISNDRSCQGYHQVFISRTRLHVRR